MIYKVIDYRKPRSKFIGYISICKGNENFTGVLDALYARKFIDDAVFIGTRFDAYPTHNGLTLSISSKSSPSRPSILLIALVELIKKPIADTSYKDSVVTGTLKDGFWFVNNYVNNHATNGIFSNITLNVNGIVQTNNAILNRPNNGR